MRARVWCTQARSSIKSGNGLTLWSMPGELQAQMPADAGCMPARGQQCLLLLCDLPSSRQLLACKQSLTACGKAAGSVQSVPLLGVTAMHHLCSDFSP